jgi:putative membrane protein
MTRHAGKRFLLMAVAVLMVCAFAVAQQEQPGEPQQNPPGQQPQVPGQQPTTPGYPNYPSTAGPTGPQQSMSRSFADQMFLREMLSGSTAEAQMSQLAQQKSSSSDVKKYSLRMVQIHTQLTNQLKPVAQMLDVKVNQKPSKKDRKTIARLKTLSGPAFDQAYIKAMAKRQKHDVKTLKDEENAAQTPAIQQAARVDAPVFSQHLQLLQEIAQNHQVTIGSK